MPVTPVAKLRLLDLFTSLEAAMKLKPRYQSGGEGERAQADWSEFRRDAGPAVAPLVDSTTRQVLLVAPPRVEIFREGRPFYDPNTQPLQGGRRRHTEGARLIEASVRVRNNLVHGGKEYANRERHPKHDQQVVEAAIDVLTHAQRWLQGQR